MPATDVVVGYRSVMVYVDPLSEDATSVERRLQEIAIATEARLDALPQVPTMAEAGLPQLRYDGWFGLLAPAGTPLAIREKIYAEVSRALAQPEMRAALEAQGFQPRPGGPLQFEAALKTDSERYGRLFKNAPR